MSAPAGAKQPQDHKTPATTEDGPLVVAVDGHDYTIERDALDDFELMDDLGRLEQGQIVRLPAVLRRLLGDEQYAAAVDAIRDPETGRVTLERGAAFVGDLLKGGADPS